MSRRDWLRGLWLACGAGIAGLIVVLSVADFGPLGPTVVSDKWQHLLAYAVLAGWFCAMAPGAWLRCALAALALGVVMEIVQYHLPHRRFEWLDMVADAAGAVLGVGVARLCFPEGVGQAIRRHLPGIGI